MKIKYLLMILSVPVLMGSCVDLDYNEVSTYDEEWTLHSRVNGVQKLVTTVYSYLDYDYGDKYGGAMRASATDESEYAWSTSSIHTFYNGAWSAINHNSSTWSDAYNGIRAANLFLEKASDLDFEEFKNNEDYFSFMQRYQYFPYEVRFLRAYFHFLLAREYGDVPLVTRMLTPEEANVVSRDNVKTVFQFIVDECNDIVDKLPQDYSTIEGQETGRINQAAVMALKARTLLYAASPLFNTTHDQSLWEEAARASLALIDSCSAWGYNLGAYNKLWGTDAYKNSEILLRRPVGDKNSFEGYNFPIGVENGQSGNCPTQTLVDAYEMAATGKLWNEPGSGYNPDKPYDGRDPRLGMTIVKNGDTGWPSYNSTPIETFEGGNSGAPLLGATPSGYYLRKLCDASVDLRPNSSKKTKHTWIVFRLGEVYLNYAEAAYHVFGDATSSSSELRLSANDAVNVVRARPGVDMPPFEGNAGFFDRYMRERQVELAFEGHRYWDVRRWKRGAECFGSVTLMKFTRDATSGVVTGTRVVKERIWEDRMYFSPIPDAEIRKNPNLKQNPGW